MSNPSTCNSFSQPTLIYTDPYFHFRRDILSVDILHHYYIDRLKTLVSTNLMFHERRFGSWALRWFRRSQLTRWIGNRSNFLWSKRVSSLQFPLNECFATSVRSTITLKPQGFRDRSIFHVGTIANSIDNEKRIV